MGESLKIPESVMGQCTRFRCLLHIHVQMPLINAHADIVKVQIFQTLESSNLYS